MSTAARSHRALRLVRHGRVVHRGACAHRSIRTHLRLVHGASRIRCPRGPGAPRVWHSAGTRGVSRRGPATAVTPPRSPNIEGARCTRFFTVLDSGTFWKQRRGPPPPPSTSTPGHLQGRRFPSRADERVPPRRRGRRRTRPARRPRSEQDELDKQNRTRHRGHVPCVEYRPEAGRAPTGCGAAPAPGRLCLRPRCHPARASSEGGATPA